jgi:hypothetical protein
MLPVKFPLVNLKSVGRTLSAVTPIADKRSCGASALKMVGPPREKAARTSPRMPGVDVWALKRWSLASYQAATRGGVRCSIHRSIAAIIATAKPVKNSTTVGGC